jgi:hypothetical protein
MPDKTLTLSDAEINVALQALPMGRPFQYGPPTEEFEKASSAFDSLLAKLSAAGA